MAKTIRDAYGEALAEFGQNDQRVVVLDADVSGSTKSATFGKVCPQRFLNVGISEANMTAMAAGLAAVGKIPFANTFAVFLTSIGLTPARAFGSYSELPIKLVGAYSGLSDSFDGPSHHALEDIAVMRTLPNFQVFVASDNVQTRWLVKHAIDTPKPMYLRMSRDAFPDLYAEDESFEAGKGKVLRDGKDVTIFACGLTVGNAMQAAQLLEADGISARVVDMFSIKPIDEELIVRCAGETRGFVSAEEHNVLGGLGSAVAEVMAKEGLNVPMAFVGVQDTHAECGPYQKLQEKYGLDAASIAAAAKNVLK